MAFVLIRVFFELNLNSVKPFRVLYSVREETGKLTHSSDSDVEFSNGSTNEFHTSQQLRESSSSDEDFVTPKNPTSRGRPNWNFSREDYRTLQFGKRQQLQQSAVNIAQASGSSIVASVRCKMATKSDWEYTNEFSRDAPAATSTPIKERNNQRGTSASSEQINNILKSQEAKMTKELLPNIYEGLFISSTKNIAHQCRSTMDPPHHALRGH